MDVEFILALKVKGLRIDMIIDISNKNDLYNKYYDKKKMIATISYIRKSN